MVSVRLLTELVLWLGFVIRTIVRMNVTLGVRIGLELKIMVRVIRVG